MSYITRNLRQKISIWTPGTPDGFGGFTWSKREAKGRWEERAELFTDEKGQERASDTVVYLTTDVNVGDWVMLGTSTESDPTNTTGAREVRDFRKIPELKARRFARRALLSKGSVI